ncbi:MAG: hypothetical protein EOO20_20940 [Chryseobacterium sp.]|nr:MAG: hypothetical protein EOO20_20940 [Chryseobacterium sp.]
MYLQTQMVDRVYTTPMAVRQEMISFQSLLSQQVTEANHIVKRIFSGKLRMEVLLVGNKELYKASGGLNLLPLLVPNSKVGKMPSSGGIAFVRSRGLSVCPLIELLSDNITHVL